ncbi:LysR substrate-binding domain-containing protein [Frigidibacter sp. MR17.24]|uniref:LysR substrate-binding domain-containing protein n=1 Tax=Frigidibacter sp. MR17.24 TaxID=3127345 RepID=UPI003012B270
MVQFRRRHLPSLGAFATFEVAAKHLSFTLAAKELNVTQGAISQQIRLLEKALGTALFVRGHKALSLTPDGAGLLVAVTAGLDSIGAGVAQLRGETGPQVVTISATDAMAAFWLAPRLAAYRRQTPEVTFTVLASDEDDALRNYAEVDIAILCGNERCEVGDELHFLFPEIAQPVCSPGFLAEHGPFDDPHRLSQMPLLHLHERHWSSEAIGWQPLGWAEWFRARGEAAPPGPPALASNKVGLLIEAAVAGEGVMLGWRHLIEAQMADGRLVPAHPATITAGRGNFLGLRRPARDRPAVAGVVGHLLASASGPAAAR